MNSNHRAPTSAYVHIPFCVSKCYYCDFGSHVGLEYLFDDYARAVAREIERTAAELGSGYGFERERSPLSTIYFGGGTPTVLSPSALGIVLDSLMACFGVDQSAEVTIEANPDTLEGAKLEQLLELGFNRLSLGFQSFDDEMLARLGRVHTAQQAVALFRQARRSGFGRVSVDLMFALPGQTIEHFRRELETLLSLLPEHVSLYELTVESGTPLAQMRDAGLVELPEEEAKLAMYEMAITELTAAGYEHYEVSNFAMPGFRCRHNQVYWRNEPFYGFGAGATSYIAGVRSHRVLDPEQYVRCIVTGADPIDYSEKLCGRSLLGETLMLGLRMLDGVDLEQVRLFTGLDPLTEFGTEIADLTRRRLLQLTGDRLRVTHRGLLLLNDVCEAFVEPFSSVDPATSPSTKP
ncbi:MAG: radical SAM family heme chaperone HemW [Armatimonadota bacterium]|nr:radical SAM family heme chaperone HemW [Armatimonadota bacterium]